MNLSPRKTAGIPPDERPKGVVNSGYFREVIGDCKIEHIKICNYSFQNSFPIRLSMMEEVKNVFKKFWRLSLHPGHLRNISVDKPFERLLCTKETE